MSEPLYDVVVIGAGPAGNICAYMTAQAGLSTLVLEEHKEAGLFVNCTGIIGVEAFRRGQTAHSILRITCIRSGKSAQAVARASPTKDKNITRC